MAIFTKIKHLIPYFGNDIGSISSIVDEDETRIYYYDQFHHWCYFYKWHEGKDFEYVV
jgi:hypothetical protein